MKLIILPFLESLNHLFFKLTGEAIGFTAIEDRSGCCPWLEDEIATGIVLESGFRVWIIISAAEDAVHEIVSSITSPEIYDEQYLADTLSEILSMAVGLTQRNYVAGYKFSKVTCDQIPKLDDCELFVRSTRFSFRGSMLGVHLLQN